VKINQSWSTVLLENMNPNKLKMELAAFARQQGHEPVAYRTIPLQWDAHSGEIRGRVEVLCIAPDGAQV